VQLFSIIANRKCIMQVASKVSDVAQTKKTKTAHKRNTCICMILFAFVCVFVFMCLSVSVCVCVCCLFVCLCVLSVLDLPYESSRRKSC
jgi:MFS superfamily sulfate permease-like transporter